MVFCFTRKIFYFLLLVLANLIFAISTSAQWIKNDKVFELQQMMIDKDPNSLCEVVGNSIFQHRVYFFEYSPHYAQATITVFTSNGKSLTAQSPFIFNMPFSYIKVDSFEITLKKGTKVNGKMRDNWEIGKLNHVILTSEHDSTAVAHVEQISCAPPCQGGALDKQVVPLLTSSKKISLLTLSAGAITCGSTMWYFKEKLDTQNNDARYQNAISESRANDLKSQADKSRARRDVAGYFSIASGLTFSILFIRDMIRKCGREYGEQPSAKVVSFKNGDISLKPTDTIIGMKIAVCHNF